MDAVQDETEKNLEMRRKMNTGWDAAVRKCEERKDEEKEEDEHKKRRHGC